MNFESLMAKLQTLNSSVEALAAIGGELRLRREELNRDPRVRPLLQEVVQLIDPELLDGTAGRRHRLMGTGIGPCAQEPIPKRHRRARRVSFAEGRPTRGRERLHPGLASRTVYSRKHCSHSAGAHSPGTYPGGWLIFGLHPQPPSALGQALANLRMVRGGGHPWTTNEVEQRLNAHGFERIEALSPFPPIMFVLGQRPVISDRTKIVD